MQRQATLLVLGASLYQIPFIRAARSLGYRVLTADNRPENEGHALADASFDCDTTDIGAILSLARAQKVDGILAAATDVALEAVAHAAAELGLRAPPVACVNALTRKLDFRKLQARLGLQKPETYAPGETVSAFPCIVKPNRASGSKGIRIVLRREDLDDALRQASIESVDKTAFAEAYLDGAQGTAEGVMRAGRIAACLVTDRSTAPAPYVATSGHRTPSSMSKRMVGALYAQIEKVFGALGYADGPFDCDFMAYGGDVVLIEMTPRAGGNSLVDLLKASADFDMPAYAVRHALGETIEEPEFNTRSAAIRILGADREGVLQYDIEEVERLRKEPWIWSMRMDREPGAHVRKFTDGRYRLGEVTVLGSSQEEVDARMEDSLRRIGLRVV